MIRDLNNENVGVLDVRAAIGRPVSPSALSNVTRSSYRRKKQTFSYNWCGAKLRQLKAGYPSDGGVIAIGSGIGRIRRTF